MKSIVVSGGGTGGHIYPALSIIKEVKKRYPDIKINYIGSVRGLEKDIVTREGINFCPLDVQGFQRKISLYNFKTIYKFIKAVKKSKQYLLEHKPDVVVGSGGYVSAPALYAAKLLRIPTLIHEQNTVPGITTKFLSLFSDRVAISFEETKKKIRSQNIILTGNPRASEVLSASSYEGKKNLNMQDSFNKIVLMVGGSQGAYHLNKVFDQVINSAHNYTDITFVFVTGKNYYEKHYSDYKNEADNIKIYPFIYNMPEILAASTLVVSRAGASILSEIVALGKPSILIPSPYVTNNHQEHNARELEKKGAATLILEKNFTPEALFSTMKNILSKTDIYNRMSLCAKKLSYPDAVDKIVDELEKISTKRH